MTAKQPDLFFVDVARAVQAIIDQHPGAKIIRIWANGHDVTDRMPLTRAELERQRPK